jgi:hypothetical protein
MGHIRLGKLPASQKWRDVVALLDARGGPLVSSLAAAVEHAADRAFDSALGDPGFIEALWLLINIPAAAKADDFAASLEALGITVRSDPSVPEVLAALDRKLQRVRRDSHRQTTDFSIIARNSALGALQSLWRQQTPSLWTPTRVDEQTSLASLASTENFGLLAQSFFAGFLKRHLRYFLDRRLAHHVHPGSFATSVADLNTFDGALRRHCDETTLIMRGYARDWLGKNQHHLNKVISRPDVSAFAAHAFTKIRSELEARGSVR